MTIFEDDNLSDAISAQHRREREVCVCGHPLAQHHALGACTVTLPPVGVDRFGRYCRCLDYDEEQQS